MLQVDAKGAPVKDAAGNYVVGKNPDGTEKPFMLTYAPDSADDDGADPAEPEGDGHVVSVPHRRQVGRQPA